MKQIRYQRWDVFTNQPFAGNQLAVIPDADNIGSDAMLRIANEFALPETAFVVSATDRTCNSRIRIFTPERELPMAGHPTIGTTFALAKVEAIPKGVDQVRLELGIGPTVVELEWADSGLRMAWMTQEAPDLGPYCDDVRALSKMLGIDYIDVLAPKPCAQALSSGVQLLFVPLRSREAVDKAVLNRGELVSICESLKIPECPVYIFSIEKRDDGATTYSRMFAPVFGISEDPATGGASGPLAAYIGRYCPDLIPEDGHMVNVQGVKMGRPSRILMSLTKPNPESTRILVGGEAVYIGEGVLSIDASAPRGAT